MKFQERTERNSNETKQRNKSCQNTTLQFQISIKEILTRKWFLIQQQPLLKQIFSTEGAVHDVIQKGEFTERHTRKSKIIAKAEEPDYVFRTMALHQKTSQLVE